MLNGKRKTSVLGLLFSCIVSGVMWNVYSHLRHPDLDFREVASATRWSFVGFPLDFGHVEASGPLMQPETWCRIITTQGQVHYFFL